MDAFLPSLQPLDLLKALHIEAQEDDATLNLCAYENALSHTATRFLSTPLHSRYRLGTLTASLQNSVTSHGLALRRFRRLDELEQTAHKALLSMLGGVNAELRALSGVHATTSILLATTQVGDTVYSLSPEDGGHFATRYLVQRAGRRSRYLAFDPQRVNLDLANIAQQFGQNPPDFILLDHGTPLFPLPLQALRDLAGPEAILDYDASHTMGLIAGGLFQNPLSEGCDILHGNTHKSFPGPQKALMVFADHRLARRVQDGLDAGLVSSQHTHHLIALCATILEMQTWAKPYAQQMRANARALENGLKGHGLVAVQSPFQNGLSHLVLLEAPSMPRALRWFESLRASGIATNVRPLFGKSIMRLGVQEVTRRGFVEEDMSELAHWLYLAITEQAAPPTIKAQVAAKRRQKNRVHFSFDASDAQPSPDLLPPRITSDRPGFEVLRFDESDYAPKLAGVYKPDLQTLQASYERLKPDPYLPGPLGYRLRRFGRFHYDRMQQSLTPLAHKPFLQAKEFNVQVGGILRHFEPLEATTRENPLLHRLIRFHVEQLVSHHPDIIEWKVFVHQIRILAQTEQPGLPTPEGIHQDGHYYVAQILMNRLNAAGAQSRIFDAKRRLSLETTLRQPLDSLLVNDRRVYHEVTELRCADPALPGRRDILLIDFNPYEPDSD